MIGAVVMLLAAQPAPVDLGDVLRFRVPAECEMGETLESIVESMARTNPETFEGEPPPPISVPGFAEPIAPRFERKRTVEGNADIREVRVDLPLPGVWHGLRVLRLRRFYTEESDHSAVEIDFAEPADRVRSSLNAAGFQLRPVGEWRSADPQAEVGRHIAVVHAEDGSTLSCSIG